MSFDLVGLRTEIKTILDAANVALATRDLSAGLADRVKKVGRINPTKLPIQASLYPYVTIYTDRKPIEPSSIGKDQASVQRRAKVGVKIVGLVFLTTQATPEVDDPQDDCERLMENIEEILRNNPTLTGRVKWQFPTGVTYHTLPSSSTAHLRAGIMDLECTVFY